MRRSWTTITSIALLFAVGSCARDIVAPTFGPRTLVSQRLVGESMPSRHDCTPVMPSTEQWVYFSRMSLVINQFDSVELTAVDEYGNAQFHIDSAGTKVYERQFAFGGARGARGYLLPAQDGTRELRMQSPTSIYSNIDDFTGRISGDSAIITDRVHCNIAVNGDSVHVFTVILK